MTIALRILLLGDSFTEGFGVEQGDTWARRLEQLGDHEVWNLGRMGASPLFYVVMAREFVPLLHPDVVVVQLFDNDLDENRFRHLPRPEPDGRVGALPDAMRPREGRRGPARGRVARTRARAVVPASRVLARRQGRPADLRAPGQ